MAKHSQLFAVTLMLLAIVLCFTTTAHADSAHDMMVQDDDVNGVYVGAFLIRLSAPIPTRWLEEERYGKSVAYGPLLTFGYDSAKVIRDYINKEFSGSFSGINTYVTLDDQKTIRVVLMGSTKMAEQVYDHFDSNSEAEYLGLWFDDIKGKFDAKFKKNAPVVPPADDDDGDEEDGGDGDDNTPAQTTDDSSYPGSITVSTVFIRTYDYDALCANGKKDNDEVDVDCGGPNCPPCYNVASASCNVDLDCPTGYNCSTDKHCVSAYAPNADSSPNSAMMVNTTTSMVMMVVATMMMMATTMLW